MLYADFYYFDFYIRELCSDTFRQNTEHQKALCDFMNSLTDEEQKAFKVKARVMYEIKNLFYAKDIKITPNTVYIASRFKNETGYACFPMLEQQKRGRDTRPFTWAMSILDKTNTNQSIHSTAPVKSYLRKKSRIYVSNSKGFLTAKVKLI